MAQLINEIIAIGGTTAHRRPFDEHRILDEFIAAKRGICCFVAVDDAQILGFQALEWCDPDWPGEDRLPADWAVIGTYVVPEAHGRGIGRALFRETAGAAKAAGVRFIDATIRKENAGGQAFYGSIGFVDYRGGAESVSKRFAPD
ncbi:N-acetyltransferase family protein [Labrys neptuniae]